MKTESTLPSKWARAEAMTVHELLEETTLAADGNIPDGVVASYQAMSLCAGRHAKAVVWGLLMASLRILTDCEEDGSFEIPNAAIVARNVGRFEGKTSPGTP